MGVINQLVIDYIRHLRLIKKFLQFFLHKVTKPSNIPAEISYSLTPILHNYRKYSTFHYGLLGSDSVKMFSQASSEHSRFCYNGIFHFETIKIFTLSSTLQQERDERKKNS